MPRSFRDKSSSSEGEDEIVYNVSNDDFFDDADDRRSTRSFKTSNADAKNDENNVVNIENDAKNVEKVENNVKNVESDTRKVENIVKKVETNVKNIPNANKNVGKGSNVPKKGKQRVKNKKPPQAMTIEKLVKRLKDDLDMLEKRTIFNSKRRNYFSKKYFTLVLARVITMTGELFKFRLEGVSDPEKIANMNSSCSKAQEQVGFIQKVDLSRQISPSAELDVRAKVMTIKSILFGSNEAAEPNDPAKAKVDSRLNDSEDLRKRLSRPARLPPQPPQNPPRTQRSFSPAARRSTSRTTQSPQRHPSSRRTHSPTNRRTNSPRRSGSPRGMSLPRRQFSPPNRRPAASRRSRSPRHTLASARSRSPMLHRGSPPRRSLGSSPPRQDPTAPFLRGPPPPKPFLQYPPPGIPMYQPQKLPSLLGPIPIFVPGMMPPGLMPQGLMPQGLMPQGLIPQRFPPPDEFPRRFPEEKRSRSPVPRPVSDEIGFSAKCHEFESRYKQVAEENLSPRTRRALEERTFGKTKPAQEEEVLNQRETLSPRSREVYEFRVGMKARKDEVKNFQEKNLTRASQEQTYKDALRMQNLLQDQDRNRSTEARLDDERTRRDFYSEAKEMKSQLEDRQFVDRVQLPRPVAANHQFDKVEEEKFGNQSGFFFDRQDVKPALESRIELPKPYIANRMAEVQDERSFPEQRIELPKPYPANRFTEDQRKETPNPISERREMSFELPKPIAANRFEKEDVVLPKPFLEARIELPKPFPANNFLKDHDSKPVPEPGIKLPKPFSSSSFLKDREMTSLDEERNKFPEPFPANRVFEERALKRRSAEKAFTEEVKKSREESSSQRDSVGNDDVFREAMQMQSLLEEQSTVLTSSRAKSEEKRFSSELVKKKQPWPTFVTNESSFERQPETSRNVFSDFDNFSNEATRRNLSPFSQRELERETNQRNKSPEIVYPPKHSRETSQEGFDFQRESERETTRHRNRSPEPIYQSRHPKEMSNKDFGSKKSSKSPDIERLERREFGSAALSRHPNEQHFKGSRDALSSEKRFDSNPIPETSTSASNLDKSEQGRSSRQNKPLSPKSLTLNKLQEWERSKVENYDFGLKEKAAEKTSSQEKVVGSQWEEQTDDFLRSLGVKLTNEDKSLKPRDKNDRTSKPRDENSRTSKPIDENDRTSKPRDENSRTSKPRDENDRQSKLRDEHDRPSKPREENYRIRSRERSRSPPPRPFRSDRKSPERSSRLLRKSPERLSRSDRKSPERSSRSDRKSPERSSRSYRKSPERLPKSNWKSPERLPRSDLKSPERASRFNRKSPERSSRSEQKSPERLSRSDWKSPERLTRSDQKSPIRSTRSERKVAEKSSKPDQISSERSTRSDRKSPNRKSRFEPASQGNPENPPIINDQSSEKSNLEKSQTSDANLLCVCCLARNHLIANCQKFVELSLNDRWTIVRKLSVKFCVKCLNVDHMVTECDLRKSASHADSCCDRFHNLLHLCTNMNRSASQTQMQFLQSKAESDRKIEELQSRHEVEKREKLRKKAEDLRKLENARKLDRMVNEQKQQSMAFLAQLQAHKEEAEREKAAAIEKMKLKDEMARLPKPSWVEVCSLCKSDKHKVADCPQNYCKRCAKQGHLSEDCKFKESEVSSKAANDSKQMSIIEYQHAKGKAPPPPSISKPSTSRETELPNKNWNNQNQMDSSSFGSKPSFQHQQQSTSLQHHQQQYHQQQQNQQQHQQQQQHYQQQQQSSDEYGGALWEHFYRELIFAKQNPHLADRIVKFWSLAGHDESSLRRFVEKHRPENPDLLRLLLVSELVNAPATGFQIGVSVDDVLDMTTSFFLSETRKSVGETEESRVASLEPLQVFIASKMRAMAVMFGINEDYIGRVSTTIRISVSKIGFSLDGLKRHYTDLGLNSLKSVLIEKLKSENVVLPKGVTPPYVVTMVSDFIVDFCK